MEFMSSAINETWKLCALAGFFGFFGFFVLALFLTSHPQTVELSAARSSTLITFFSTTSSSSPATDQPVEQEVESSSTTSINATTNSTSNGLFKGEISTEQRDHDSTNSTDTTIAANTSLTATNFEEPATTSSNATSSVSLPPLPPSINSAPTGLRPLNTTADRGEEVAAAGDQNIKKYCNLFKGRWVYRPNVSPMYSVFQCPFLEEKMSCRRNGRPDSEYEGWSWEATDCDIPLFNGRDMLERLRGKRVIMAGDSLNRNQWESLACLIYTSISPSRAFVDAQDASYKVLKALDYDFTLEFYWCPFLVFLEENDKSRRKALHLDKLDPSSDQWRGADVMFFNSGHWWTHHGKFRAWDVFRYRGETTAQMSTELAYKRALTTWSNWITQNVDPNKTAVFFRSISPEHKGKLWCYNATRPLEDGSSYANTFPRSMIDVVERQVAATWFPVRYLNITWLSGYRRDAHPAMYRYKDWRSKADANSDDYAKTVEQLADCSHWCLPGLPDTWNRLLYASLFFSENTASANANGGEMIYATAADNDNNTRIEEGRKRVPAVAG